MPIEKNTFVGAFKSARKRDGLTERHVAQLLGQGRADADAHWEAIEQSSFAATLIRETGEPFFESILRYFRAVAARLPDQQRWVVDLTLALGMDELKIRYATELGPSKRTTDTRRAQAMSVLSSREAKNPDFVEVPSGVSTYVQRIEEPSLAAFAELLAAPRKSDFDRMRLDPSAFAEFVTTQRARRRSDGPQVVVLGGAVMDINFRIPQIPPDGASVQAVSYRPHPGGKGLSQAVACARLGLDTALISVVGDDDFGTRILKFLEDEQVNTRFVDVRSKAESMVSGVITREDSGGSFAIGWRNDQPLHFSPRDLRECGGVAAIEECDYLLASFELPSGTVSSALELAKRAKATTIVTPAPPYENQMLDADHRRNMDYLVANTWELTEFARGAHREIEGRDQIDKLARPLVMGRTGVRNVLVTHHPLWHAYTRRPGGKGIDEFPIIWPIKEYESAGDRDAFCAMLTLQLHLMLTGETASLRRALFWAAAAMAARRRGVLSVPDSMPLLEEVHELVEQSDIQLPD